MKTEREQNLPRPRPGQRVLSLSGDLLGAVHSTTDDGFVAILGRDRKAWLPNDVIYLIDGNDVTLICEEDGLHHYERSV